MTKKKSAAKQRISGQAMRQFADNRRIADKAVKKAIEENKRIGITEDTQFAK
jgi:hypothetical protein